MYFIPASRDNKQSRKLIIIRSLGHREERTHILEYWRQWGPRYGPQVPSGYLRDTGARWTILRQLQESVSGSGNLLSPLQGDRDADLKDSLWKASTRHSAGRSTLSQSPRRLIGLSEVVERFESPTERIRITVHASH